eukprot:COSAG05_NODE_2968_length_2457_cov_7.905004_2_plen_211_part_00
MEEAKAAATVADATEHRLRSELSFVREALQKVEQQRTMVVQLLGLLRRLHTKTLQQPLQEELEDYAHYLDIDLSGPDRGLLWIAEEAYFAPLPDQYQRHKDTRGDEYFFNTATGESSYCHPMDNLFRKLAHQFSTVRMTEPTAQGGAPSARPQPSRTARGASEAIGRVYAATLPGGVTKQNLLNIAAAKQGKSATGGSFPLNATKPTMRT